MKRLLTKQIWIPVLSVVIVAQAVGLGLLWHAVRNDRAEEHDLTTRVAVNVAALDGYASLTHATVSVTDSSVYLPDLRLKLPLNDTTQKLMYDTREVGSPTNLQQTTDITTERLASFTPNGPQTIDCIPVRLAFESTPNPYNPHETNAATLHLSDGRTLQVYSYQNKLCDDQYRFTSTDSTKLAAVFKDAVAY